MAESRAINAKAPERPRHTLRKMSFVKIDNTEKGCSDRQTDVIAPCPGRYHTNKGGADEHDWDIFGQVGVAKVWKTMEKEPHHKGQYGRCPNGTLF